MHESWDIQRISEILPQRYPFLFIDKVLEVNELQGKIVCVKNVTINDYFFQGHFPEKPIMPGVLIIEAMAQASILFFSVIKPHIAQKKPDYYLGKVEAKFIAPVKAGDQLIIEVRKLKVLDTAGIVSATAKVDGKTVTQAKITFGVKVDDE
ncbi:MAG: 3-hydroxyacyl-ACP dehydratase FabZ [Candidatus Omnitrophica bacterium]|nr:3-hydroxyacyl-ACP dehydratase FabZ [Candidatus Omnitrophota bacterium]